MWRKFSRAFWPALAATVVVPPAAYGYAFAAFVLLARINQPDGRTAPIGFVVLASGPLVVFVVARLAYRQVAGWFDPIVTGEPFDGPPGQSQR